MFEWKALNFFSKLLGLMANVHDERAVLVSLLVWIELNANSLTQMGWFCSSVHLQTVAVTVGQKYKKARVSDVRDSFHYGRLGITHEKFLFTCSLLFEMNQLDSNDTFHVSTIKVNSREKYTLLFLCFICFWEIEWCQSFGNAPISETVPVIAWLTCESSTCLLFVLMWSSHLRTVLSSWFAVSACCLLFLFSCTLSTQHRARIVSTVTQHHHLFMIALISASNGPLFEECK